jgi:hypothetical protein
MNKIFEHHIPFSLMAGQTQFFFFRIEIEFMIRSLNFDMANVADFRTDRAMNEFALTHLGVAIISYASCVRLRRTGNGKRQNCH